MCRSGAEIRVWIAARRQYRALHRVRAPYVSMSVGHFVRRSQPLVTRTV